MNVKENLLVLRKIKGFMADEQSKEIYLNRLLFSITEDLQYIRKIVMKYLDGYHSEVIVTNNSFFDKLEQLDVKASYIIYGGGGNGKTNLSVSKRKELYTKSFLRQE